MQNFVKIDAQEGCLRAHLFCMVCCEEGEEKYEKLLGRFLSTLVCKVVYMVRLKYVNFKEIRPIVLKLQ